MKSVIYQEYKRMLLSRATLFILFPAVTVLLWYIFRYRETQELIRSLLENPGEVTPETIERYIAAHSGPRYLLDYWQNGITGLEYLGYFLWLGVFISSEMFSFRTDGFGAFTVSRLPYRKYSFAVLSAQTLYITTVVLISVFLQFVIGCFFGRFSFEGLRVGHYELTAVTYFLFLLVQGLINALFLSLLNLIASSLEVIFSSRFLLQFGPVFLIILFFLLSFAVSFISSSYVFLADFFIPGTVCEILSILANNPRRQVFFELFLPFVGLGIGGLILYELKNRRFSRDYI